MSQQPTIREMLLSFAEKVQQLRDLGAKDIILDPGFGFGKTLEQNYQIMGELDKLQVMGLPLLVGVSRKSMIYKLLGFTPEESLNGTTALNTIAVQTPAFTAESLDHPSQNEISTGDKTESDSTASAGTGPATGWNSTGAVAPALPNVSEFTFAQVELSYCLKSEPGRSVTVWLAMAFV
jgi:hypothetical protein